MTNSFDSWLAPGSHSGWQTNVQRQDATPCPGCLTVYQNGGMGYIDQNAITTATDLIDKWKVFIGGALRDGARDYRHRTLSARRRAWRTGHRRAWRRISVIGPFRLESEAKSVRPTSARDCLASSSLLHKPSQHATRKVYAFVPIQDWTRQWTDDDLYKKYGLTEDEIAFIEKMIRPMDLSGAADDE